MHVLYNSSGYGYRVEVIDAGQIIEEIEAGNSQHDSTARLEPGTAGTLGKATLARYARETAICTAIERGLTERDVAEDTDIEV